ncbi:MAG: HD-GYP domain-containing protein [bacterium]|jgi:HD-GYP domain-containing protein (c-di-GMP phosphodiesterase class II)
MSDYLVKIKDTKIADIAFAAIDSEEVAAGLDGGTLDELADAVLLVMPHLDVAGSLIDSRSIVFALLNIMIPGDVDIYKHSLRVQKITARFADYLGMTAKEKEFMECAAALHDLGMLAVGRETRQKAEALTVLEQKIVTLHPLLSYRILDILDFCGDIKLPVLHHHERSDGAGYPAGLTGEAITAGGRILAIANAFDAMTTGRPYRSDISVQAALRELEKGAGTQFDARLTGEFAGFLSSKYWPGRTD